MSDNYVPVSDGILTFLIERSLYEELIIEREDAAKKKINTMKFNKFDKYKLNLKDGE